MMKITRTPTTLELSRTPYGHWLFSLAFVAAGAFSVYMALMLPGALSGREQLLAGFIGSGVLAGGLYNAATTYRTALSLDFDEARLRYERSAPLRRKVVVDTWIGDVVGASIRQEHDSDGDPWFVLELHVDGVAPLFLAHASQNGRPELQRIAATIEEARTGIDRDARRTRLGR